MKTFRDFLSEAAERVALDGEAKEAIAGHKVEIRGHIDDNNDGTLSWDQRKLARDAAEAHENAIKAIRKHGLNHPKTIAARKAAFDATDAVPGYSQ